MKKSKFTFEIENKLKVSAPKKIKSQFGSEYFLKGNGTETSQLEFLNLTMPSLRHQLDTYLSTKDKSLSSEMYKDFENLWHESEIFEAKSFAVYWLDQQSPEFLIKHHKKILAWAGQVDNWAHADGLCSIYARMFEHSPDLILPTYKKWNRHQNSWLRRCSMVGTFYYSRNRKTYPSFALAKNLVSPHLEAKEYYVQKGAGWTLREMYNVYPVETLNFIKNNLHKITPIAWVAASEKLPQKIKQPLLQKRKILRKK